MKVTKIEIKERKPKTFRDYHRMMNRNTHVYVQHEQESVLQDFANRTTRPHLAYKKAFGEQVAEMLFVKVSDIQWSQKCGCSCGCSPGFKVRGSYGKDVWVTVAADEARTIDPALAQNRTLQLMSDPTIVGAMETVEEDEALARINRLF